MDLISCEFCNTNLKSKYNLKNHLSSNKKCLTLRGLKLESEFLCKGCDSFFANKKNMLIHMDICKKYIKLKLEEEYDEKNKNIKEEYESKIKSIKKEYNEKIIIKEKKIDNLQKLIDENKDLLLRYTKLEVKHEELEKQHEKTIAKLEMKITQCDSFIQKLALEGSNKVTSTTNNTVTNTIRNQLSPTYTLENKQLEKTMRDNYTEHDFFGGQKRLANFFFEKVIKTPDDKMLICCTDMSRKKFKILDLRGNLKEDIEARQLCEKLKVPTQMITKEIYDKVIDRIDTECDRLSSDDRSRREKLLDDTMKAQQVYIDNMNFDDLNYNQDFMHELCVLLNV